MRDAWKSATALVLVMLVVSSAGAAEDVPWVDPVGRWPNGFSFAAVADDALETVYVASGGTVLVAPIMPGPRQSEIAAEVVTEGFVFGLAADGDDLFIAGSRAGLFHVDISKRRRPGEAKLVERSGDICWDVAARGDLVAAADGRAGVAFFRRGEDGVTPLSRVAEVGEGRALGVWLGDGFCLVAGGEGDVFRIDLTDPEAPSVTARQPTTGIARSVALTTDGRYCLVAEDTGDLTLRDVETLEIVRQRRFVLPAIRNPGPQRAPEPELPLAVSRVRVKGDRGYVGLEGTTFHDQFTPFTPEYGAYKGEDEYNPRAATAVFSLRPDDDGVPSLAIEGQAHALHGHPWMNWVKDVVPLAGDDFLINDFVTGVFQFRLVSAEQRGGPAPRLVEIGRELDHRAGAIDVVLSPTDPNLLYASSDIGKMQVFDISERSRPRLLHRNHAGGGTFCGATSRIEPDENGVERPFDYVFVNNFFRVMIFRIDPKAPRRCQQRRPLWITVPEAVRAKQEFSDLGLTPRSYRVWVEGDHLDIVATNTVFGYQRFSIRKVLESQNVVNIYAHLKRPPEYALHVEPEWRAITSVDHVLEGERLLTRPFPRGGRVMSLHQQGEQIVLGASAQHGAGRGGAPHPAYLQYFDLRDPVVQHERLGPLRFPRATSFFEDGDVLIGLERKDDRLFVADTAGFLRVVDFVPEPADPGPHGEGYFVPRDWIYENLSVYGRDSMFDVRRHGDELHTAGWSSGYICLSIDESDPARYLKPVARYDSPGLSISVEITADGFPVVAEHNAGFFIMPPASQR